ncbi:MAG: hypothetical protein OSB41_07945 [Kiritimatiellae bacterium]|nr:hypothetical protein [Kiritimatiellia bacterium]
MSRCGEILMMTALVCVWVASSGCAGFIRPYDPLTEPPRTLIGDELLPQTPTYDPVDEARDKRLEALERQMGIGKSQGK